MGITGDKSSRRRGIERILVSAAIAFVLWFQYWTVDSSLGFRHRLYEEYYRFLVDGFRAGQTNLPITTHPTMLTLRDPYDPAQNSAYRMPDGSYYQGKYYLYFGATPAVGVLLPYSLLTESYMSTGTAVYLLCGLGFLTLTWIWLRVRRDYFPESGVWIVPLGVLVLGLCTHTLALERRPMFWELPIASGFAFAAVMLACVYQSTRLRRPALILGFAGLCLGLAATSRPPFLLTISLFLPVLWLAWKRERSWQGCVRWLGPAAIAFSACVVGVMLYNYARFDDPFQFGQSYQLTGVYERKMRHFHLSYLIHNLYIYYFCPVRWTWEFPFVSARPPENSPLGYYAGEPVAGVGVTFFIFWTILVVPVLGWRALKNRALGLVAFLGSTALVTTTMAVFLGSFFSATPRYQADFSPYLAFLAVCGWLEIERSLQRRWLWWRIVHPLLGAAGVASVVFGLLLSVDYHTRIIWRDHYWYWNHLQDFWDPKIARARSWFGYKLGRHTIRVKLADKPFGTVETLWSNEDRHRHEQILLRKINSASWIVGYEANDVPLRWSAPFVGSDGKEHLIEMQTPGLQEPVDRSRTPQVVRRALLANSTVVIWVDGRCAISELVPDLVRPIGKLSEGHEFSGEVIRERNKLPRLDMLPDESLRDWCFAGFNDVAIGETIELVSWGVDAARESFLFRRTDEKTAQIVFRDAQGSESASREFTLGESGTRVEFEHPAVWPWSAGDDEQQRFTVFAQDRLVGDFRPRVHGARAELVRVNSGRSVPANTIASAGNRIPAQGGILRLRFLAEPGTFGFGQPIVVLGRVGDGDWLYLIDSEGFKVRFDHWGNPLLQSRSFPLREGALNTLDIALPSFSSPVGQGRHGPITLTMNERTILNSQGTCGSFDSDSFYIGANPLGGTTCQLEFGGYLLDARWIVEDPKK